MLILLIVATMGSSFLLAFLLLVNPLNQNERANKYLGAAFWTIGMAMLDVYLEQTNTVAKIPYTSFLIDGTRYLLAPFLFLSVSYFVSPIRRFLLTDYLHFIPFIYFLIVRNYHFFTGNDFERTYILIIHGHTFSEYFLPIQNLINLIVCYRILSKHHQNIELISSDTSEINLDWLRNLILITGVSVIFWINEIFFEVEFLMIFTPYVYALSIYFVAYFALKQKAIFSFQKKELVEISEVIEQQKTENQKPKRLSELQIRAYSAKLEKLISADKIYLNNSLSLPDLANSLELSIHDTSFLINEITGDNFYHLINKYRIEEAKQLLLSNKIEELNILGIAFESGFNSKTTFNTTFKKILGISPTQFVEKQRKSVRLDNLEL